MADNFPYSRILVTGGAGFLGKFVVQRLRGYANLQIFVPRKQEYDLVREPDSRRLLDDVQPDLIIHLAALVGGIGINQQQPGRFFYDNLMMGAHLIELARLRGVKKFVAVGTVCAYPKHTQTPFKEEDLWNGYPEETNAPYALAKKMMLVQSQSYRAQYGFNSIFLLPANLYGPGDNFDLQTGHVIPALIRKCVEARETNRPFIEVWGTGQASREFLYVGDCADGVVRAATAYDESDPVNLGTGTEIQIGDLTSLIARLTGYRGEIRWQLDRPDGQPKRRLDVTRALEKFGFRAHMQLEDGLKETIEWYEANRSGVSQSAEGGEVPTSINV
ncbi:MAG TPA: GDP-L-fucose synthase [Pyrinomonadaceae bacterium]|nr:GDP-L-fucose synthase [Pyrinomonadaceae bacterium]